VVHVAPRKDSTERGHAMHLRHTVCTVLLLMAGAAVVASVPARDAAETFTATATVKAAGGATANAPVEIVIERKTSEGEATRLREAFTAGGEAAFRKALVGMAPTGSIRLGGGNQTATRVTLERPTDKGRLLTIVTDKPILFLGAGVPGAKPKEGYDFAILDIEVSPAGAGSGTLSPAAKVTVKEGAFVVGDYASELIRLTDVKKVK
jgi:hypothetical protein